MVRFFTFFQMSFFLFCGFLHATQNAPLDCIQQECSTDHEQKMVKDETLVYEKVQKLWDEFQRGRTFTPFKIGQSEKDLKEEFETIRATRLLLLEIASYQYAENLFTADLIRAPGCVAFAYNNTTPDFNASTVYLGKRAFIASEGPRSKDIPKFFNLLTTKKVTHLLRLTGSYEGWTKKCHPYWDGLIDESTDGTYLNIPTENGIHSIHAFHMDYWRDDCVINPYELLGMALKVKKELDETNGLLLVHCSAGVGRTGTFLAALAIIDAIDRSELLSIEEIVYRLSLQRLKSVAKLEQYATLYRLAEIYLKKIDV